MLVGFCPKMVLHVLSSSRVMLCSFPMGTPSCRYTGVCLKVPPTELWVALSPRLALAALFLFYDILSETHRTTSGHDMPLVRTSRLPNMPTESVGCSLARRMTIAKRPRVSLWRGKDQPRITTVSFCPLNPAWLLHPIFGHPPPSTNPTPFFFASD